jgi:hypothetical protein
MRADETSCARNEYSLVRLHSQVSTYTSFAVSVFDIHNLNIEYGTKRQGLTERLTSRVAPA